MPHEEGGDGGEGDPSHGNWNAGGTLIGLACAGAVGFGLYKISSSICFLGRKVGNIERAAKKIGNVERTAKIGEKSVQAFHKVKLNCSWGFTGLVCEFLPKTTTIGYDMCDVCDD